MKRIWFGKLEKIKVTPHTNSMFVGIKMLFPIRSRLNSRVKTIGIGEKKYSHHLI